MTYAYLEGTVKQLLRTFTLDSDANRLTLEDTYRFDETPRSLEEAFITFEDVEISQDGQSVQIGTSENNIQLSAVGITGKFNANKLVEESKEGRTDQIINRITFVPANLDIEMRLSFKIGSAKF